MWSSSVVWKVPAGLKPSQDDFHTVDTRCAPAPELYSNHCTSLWGPQFIDSWLYSVISSSLSHVWTRPDEQVGGVTRRSLTDTDTCSCFTWINAMLLLIKFIFTCPESSLSCPSQLLFPPRWHVTVVLFSSVSVCWHHFLFLCEWNLQEPDFRTLYYWMIESQEPPQVWH